jgi:chemotaxis signal transduction protein
MNETPNETLAVPDKAAELRQAFDRSFAVPPPNASEEIEDLLTIRVAGDPYAIRLRDIAGMVAVRKVVPVPAATPHLLGLLGIRGNIVPVFGLASILGYPQGPEPPRWMILCGGEQPIGLAFSDFEGHLRISRSCLHDQVANTVAGVRTVIDIPPVVAAIRKRSEP